MALSKSIHISLIFVLRMVIRLQIFVFLAAKTIATSTMMFLLAWILSLKEISLCRLLMKKRRFLSECQHWAFLYSKFTHMTWNNNCRPTLAPEELEAHRRERDEFLYASRILAAKAFARHL